MLYIRHRSKNSFKSYAKKEEDSNADLFTVVMFIMTFYCRFVPAALRKVVFRSFMTSLSASVIRGFSLNHFGAMEPLLNHPSLVSLYRGSTSCSSINCDKKENKNGFKSGNCVKKL